MEKRSMNFTPLHHHRLEINMLLAIPFVPQPFSTLATYHIFQGHPLTPSLQLPNRYKQHHTSHKNSSAETQAPWKNTSPCNNPDVSLARTEEPRPYSCKNNDLHRSL